MVTSINLFVVSLVNIVFLKRFQTCRFVYRLDFHRERKNKKKVSRKKKNSSFKNMYHNNLLYYSRNKMLCYIQEVKQYIFILSMVNLLLFNWTL